MPLGTVANLTVLDKRAKVAIIKPHLSNIDFSSKGIRVRFLVVHKVIEAGINSSLPLSVGYSTYNMICMLWCILISMSVSHVHWTYHTDLSLVATQVPNLSLLA